MDDIRIRSALERIEAALARIDAARAAQARSATSDPEGEPSGTARVIALVNTHEKLREEVAETLRDLDGLIAQFDA